MQPKLIVGIILIVFAVTFIIQNVTVVDIRFLFWKISMSRALFMFMMLTIGIIVGWILHGHFRNKKK